MWTRIRAETEPASKPITLEQAKAHVRIETDDEDALVDSLIDAAVATVEGPKGIGTGLMERQWALTLDAFPSTIRLSIDPISSVDSIEYVDSAGETQTLAEADYHVDLTSEPARIEPAYGKWWPSTRDEMGAVTVTFTAGYSDAANVPAPLRQAMLLLVSHWYEHREAVVIGTITAEVPMAVDRLLAPYRVGRFA